MAELNSTNVYGNLQVSSVIKGLDTITSVKTSTDTGGLISAYNGTAGAAVHLRAVGSNGHSITDWPNSAIIEGVPYSTGSTVISSYSGWLIFQVTNRTQVPFMIQPNNGAVYFPLVGTTASASNAFLDSGNSNVILRSTSSIKYKDNVTDILDIDSEKLYSFRPITYTSKSVSDDPTKTHFGFIAEELHEVEPRLVHYMNDEPDGVQYDRMTVLLVKEVQKLRAEIDALKAQLNS